MTGLLNGKVALVTGAGSGIGRAIVTAMARAGASVVINDIGALNRGGWERRPGRRGEAEIEAFGGKAVISRETVSEWGAAQRMVQAALDAFGRLDIVVNNAGILRDAFFHKMEPQDSMSSMST